VESFHLDLVLSILIHIGQRDSVSHSGLGMKYLSMILVSLLSLALVSMYLFMGYSVSRITEAKQKYFLLEVSEMQDEPYRFWLEDKKPSGNIFQRHFNLLLLLKDVFVCVTLYVFYTRPAVLITIISIGQAAFNCAMYAYPPFTRTISNCLLLTTQSFYMLLNLLFMINIYGDTKISDETRYYFIGLGMIVVVLCIILANIGVNFYSTIIEWRKKCKKKLAERRKVQQSQPSALKSIISKPNQASKISESAVFEEETRKAIDSANQQDQTLLINDSQSKPAKPLVDIDASQESPFKDDAGVDEFTEQKPEASKLMSPLDSSLPKNPVAIKIVSRKKKLLHSVNQKQKLQ